MSAITAPEIVENWIQHAELALAGTLRRWERERITASRDRLVAMRQVALAGDLRRAEGQDWRMR